MRVIRIPAIPQGAKHGAARAHCAIRQSSQARLDIETIREISCVDLHFPAPHIRSQISEIVAHGCIEQGVGRNDEGVPGIAIAIANIAHARADAKSGQRPVVPSVFGPERCLIERRALQIPAGIACKAFGHPRIDVAVPRDHLKFPGHVAPRLELESAHPRRIGLDAEKGIDGVTG